MTRDEYLRDWERYVSPGVATAVRDVASHAHGARVTTVDGHRYLDFAGGIGVLNSGHTPEPVVRAIQEQAEQLIHACFSVIGYDRYIELAKVLAELSPIPDTQVMLVNSGVEAVENAVKIARAYTGRPGVVAFRNGFHGRTFLGMSLTGIVEPFRKPYGSLVPSVYHAPYAYCYRCPWGLAYPTCKLACVRDLENAFQTAWDPDQIGAIVIEPVLGDGGFVVPPDSYLPALRDLATRYGMLLIVDEIQTGFGRTGRWFAVEHTGVTPDLMTVAKSLAAGMPLSAVLGRRDIMASLPPGTLGGTYGGNPVACAAALANIAWMHETSLVERGQEMAKVLRQRLDPLQNLPWVGDVRGLGPMVAVELVQADASHTPDAVLTQKVLTWCHERGLVVLKAGAAGNVIRLLIPLVIDAADLDEGLTLLVEAIRMRGDEGQTPNRGGMSS